MRERERERRWRMIEGFAPTSRQTGGDVWSSSNGSAGRLIVMVFGILGSYYLAFRLTGKLGPNQFVTELPESTLYDL
ncbi:hypothetical protein IHE45_16G080800 [Dioscorea alata]|uniref:Uncharacterized protein n=1 Tax=Dioscorea alata TaxID=55571 RepID=A0ACB7UIP4_DIOAL|nr:hypothetical protein IHE45_16G080800 [Dioscorea alata]